ncbi:MAG: hypothetical protein EOO38_26770, partial [Cytophagaceae bacterium]
MRPVPSFYKPLYALTKRYALRAVTYVAPRILAVIAQLVFLPFVLHSLTLRDYGLFSVASMIGNFVALLSFPQVTYGSKVAIARGQLGQFFYSLFKRTMISLPLFVIASTILLFAHTYLGRTLIVTTIVVLSSTLLSNIMAQSAISFWVAREQFFRSSMIELARAVVVNGIGALAALGARDLVVFALVRSVADLIFSLGVVLSSARANDLWSEYKKRNIDYALTGFGLRMFWANCALVARTEGMSFVVAAHFGVDAVGIFRLAYSNIYYRLQNQLSNLTDLVYASNAREGRRVSAGRRLKQYVALGLVGVGVAILGLMSSYIYIMYTLPPQYHVAFRYVAVLLIALP